MLPSSSDPLRAYLPSMAPASPSPSRVSGEHPHREEQQQTLRGLNNNRTDEDVEVEMGTMESSMRIQPFDASSSSSPSRATRQTSAWKVPPTTSTTGSGEARSSKPRDKETNNREEVSEEDDENSDEATGLMRDYMAFQLCESTHEDGKSEASVRANEDTPPKSYHYHCRPFTMARLWWMKTNKAEVEQYRRDGTFNKELNKYLRDNRNDWMPPTGDWLRKQGSLAYLWAWEQYFFNAVLLPIGVLWLGKEDGDFGRMCRNLYQTWAFTLFHVPIPDSVMIKFPLWRKIIMCVCLTFFYLCLVVPIPLRYWEVYQPIGSDLTSRVDCWFPPALAALMNVCVAGIAVVSHDFAATEPKYQSKQVSPDDIDLNRKRQLKAAFEEATEAQLEREDQGRLRRNLKENEDEKRSHQSSLSLSLSKTPSIFLVGLCEGMKQNDFRMIAPSSCVFAVIAIMVSIMPNLVSVFWGGEFMGDCNTHKTSELECPFPVGVMRFAVLIRIMMMAITTYFFSFILHQTAVYFKNKTLVRTRLLTLLNRLLGTHDVVELIKTQTHQIEQETKVIIDNKPFSDPSSSSNTLPSSITFPTTNSPTPLSADLSNLPEDLRIWFDMYRFMDQFDQREGWQVQSTLAWYAAFVVFCCVNVLVAAIQAWTGVDQQVLFFTCALVAGLIGGYVFVILWTGIQINQLPADMHEAMRRAEMRYGQALAIVQRIVNVRAATMEDDKNASKIIASLHGCSLAVGNSLLQRFAASFDFLILSSPFTVLMVPLTKTLISTGVVAGVTTLASVIAASVSGALRGT